MAKRGNNIYHRRDGRYEGRVAIGYTEGSKVHYKYVYARTLTEVKQKMAEIYSLKESFPTATMRLTVAEGCKQWLESVKLRVKESTFANYENIVFNHILPQLGSLSFSALTTAKLNAFVSDKLLHGRKNDCGGLSAKTVRDIMTVYRSVERYAAREYGIRQSNFSMPKSERKELDILSKHEQNALEKHLSVHHSVTNAAVLLCMFSGLRIGEICGLKWGDIDFHAGTIFVKRTVQRINHIGKSEVIVGSPKSQRSIRQIPIPRFVLNELEQYRTNPTAYVVSGQSKPVEPRTMQNRFKAILKRCGLRNVNFHVLRHTYATTCIELGFDVKTLSELLGHADASLTLNRYVHSSMERKKFFVDLFTACA